MTRFLLGSLSVGAMDAHVPGLDLERVRQLVSGELVDERPIEVADVADCGHWRIINGRHRFVAALARGDETVEVTVVG
jgi:hypothetical protein